MKNTPILSNIQLAARLVDLLYRDMYVGEDSAQALFDVLADALESRPDVVAGVSQDMDVRFSQRQDYRDHIHQVMTQLDSQEQENLRLYSKQGE